MMFLLLMRQANLVIEISRNYADEVVTIKYLRYKEERDACKGVLPPQDSGYYRKIKHTGPAGAPRVGDDTCDSDRDN